MAPTYSVLSISILNAVRFGWPKKIFDSHDFTLRDSDVIHMGGGACGVPFAGTNFLSLKSVCRDEEAL